MRRRHKRRARRTLRLRLRENATLTNLNNIHFGENTLKEHGLDERDSDLIEFILEEHKNLSEKIAHLVATSRMNKSYLFPKLKNVLRETEEIQEHLVSIIQENRI